MAKATGGTPGHGAGPDLLLVGDSRDSQAGVLGLHPAGHVRLVEAELLRWLLLLLRQQLSAAPLLLLVAAAVAVAKLSKVRVGPGGGDLAFPEGPGGRVLGVVGQVHAAAGAAREGEVLLGAASPALLIG